MFRSLVSILLVGIILLSQFEVQTAAMHISTQKAASSRFQDSPSISVANFTFDVTLVEQSPTFNEEYFLGSTGDGRDWLVIRIHGHNTSSEDQKIHSDKIQLLWNGEKIKQTGDESQSVADTLGMMNIGGSGHHEIEAGQEFDFVQVYKIDPAATDLSLWMDFSGEWTLPLNNDLIQRQVTPAEGTQASRDQSWVIRTENFQLTLIGATKAQTFSGPFHLGQNPDGYDWLVVTWKIQNVNSEPYDPDGADFRLIANGVTISHSEETDSVASETTMKNPGSEIAGNSSNSSVAVYEVEQETTDFALEVQSSGTWYIDLGPAIEAANGDPQAAIESTQLDLESIYEETATGTYIPTAAPTPTPAPTAIPSPTPIPAPTQPPVYGSEDNPAGLYEAIVVGGFTVSLDGVQLADSLNYGTEFPPGGFHFLLISVTIARTGEDSGDVGPGDFTLKNLATDKTYGGELATLENVDLAPGEYTNGLVAFEVPVSGTQFEVAFAPSLFGDSGYWNFQLLGGSSERNRITESNGHRRTALLFRRGHLT